MWKVLRVRKKNVCGQGLTEYALVLSFVALACIFSAALFGKAMKAKFAEMTLALSNSDTSEVVGLQKKAGQESAENAKVSSLPVKGK